MKKLIRMALLLLLPTVFFASRAAVFATADVIPHPLSGKLILIDAGHGGIDAGAQGVNTGEREDVLNLSVAQELEKLLVSSGAVVVMTRNDDEGLYDEKTKENEKKREDMQRRAALIRETEADAVVSIHMNSFTGSKPWGAQVLYQTGSDAGRLLAESVQTELVTGLGDGNRRTATSGDFLVCRCSASPSVIVECGFLSNPEEEMKLVDESYRQRLAWHIYTGLMRYFASSNDQLIYE